MPPQEIGPGALAGAHRAGELVAGQQQVSDTTNSHSEPAWRSRLSVHPAAEQMNVVVDFAEHRLERLVQDLHDLGPRALGEFLRELGAHHFRGTEIEVALRRYSALDPAILRELGADRWPPA